MKWVATKLISQFGELMRLRPGVFYSSFFYKGDVQAQIENPYFQIEILPHWFDRALVKWSIPADWGDCSFNVYKSESETGPFTKMNSTPILGLIFNDLEHRKFSKYHQDYYIVEAILHDKNDALLRSAPYSWERQQRRWVELRSIEIQRRFWLMLRKFVGVETQVFKRKTFGKRCGTCWDPRNHKVTNDKCPECMGIGWSGGYMEPYSTLIQYDATPNNTELSVYGRNEPNAIVGMTISFPNLDDWDIVYRVKDGRMYRVDKVLTTELLTKPVSQRFQLIELPKNYAEYKLVEKYNL